jgi:hypothetical protein
VDTATTILDLAMRRASALAARDWDEVAKQLHPTFLYVNATGDLLDREAYLAFVADGPLRWNRQTLEDTSVVTAGPVAVLVATVVDEVLFDGQPEIWSFVTTQTYVNDGEWLYLAGHTAIRA